MKRFFLFLLLCLPFVVMAQTRVKETEVPKSVLKTLAQTYETYKVKAWYQGTGQYIADIVVDGQAGKSFFTATGDWQYSEFPVKLTECPTLMNSYFKDNYPGYRAKKAFFVEEMTGDNYYRFIMCKDAIDANDCELIFDTRGKLMKSNAPDPEAVKREYYTRTNPEYDDGRNTVQQGRRPYPVEDKPEETEVAPTEKIKADFDKRNPAKRIKEGPEWVRRDGGAYLVAYYTNMQKVDFEAVYNTETETLEKLGKALLPERFTKNIVKFIAEKFKGEKYEIVKMVVYTYDSKYRDPVTGKKPKPITYTVVRQKVKGQPIKYTRMEFDARGNFLGLLAQPLDKLDIQ